ncbi:unnamed protein product [Lasius platythorax]|uniref:Uncharacterized protein n=1 Tax=Lasius platythorax TaxID=488582 RepID=A0AAV2MXK1_9HYME
MATVEAEVDRDPLDLKFVDCLTAIEVEPPIQCPETIIVQTPSVIAGTKRKARKVSPDAPSEEEPGLSSTQLVPRVVLRKLKSRKRKPKDVVDEPVEEVSSVQMSMDSDWGSEHRDLIGEDSELEITGVQQLDVSTARSLRPNRKKAAPPRIVESKSSAKNDSDSEVGRRKKKAQGNGKSKKKGRARRRSLTSSDEDENSNFAPVELRAMGATAAGSLALGCLDNVEEERKNSPNINGQVSGRMKKKLIRVRKVINTLIYKAEASGYPTLLRLRNRELTEEVQKLKLNEVVVKRELDDMKSLVDTLRREISDLKDRVNEAEEDRRKARESQRIMLWRHKKERGETVCESPTVLMDDSPVKQVASVDREVNVPSRSQVTRTVEVSKPSSSSPSVLPLHKGKGKSAENKAKDISDQIRSLVRQRAELKRQAVEDSGTGSDRQRASAKPLPQRTPKVRPKILGNVQLVPPRSTDGKDKDRLDKNAFEPKESIESEWTKVRRRGNDKPRRDQPIQERDSRNNKGPPMANYSRKSKNRIHLRHPR